MYTVIYIYMLYIYIYVIHVYVICIRYILDIYIYIINILYYIYILHLHNVRICIYLIHLMCMYIYIYIHTVLCCAGKLCTVFCAFLQLSRITISVYPPVYPATIRWCSLRSCDKLWRVILDTKKWEYKGILYPNEPLWILVRGFSIAMFDYRKVMTQRYDHVHGISPVTAHGLGPCWGVYVVFRQAQIPYSWNSVNIINLSQIHIDPPWPLPNRVLEDWFPLYLAVFRVYVYVNLWDGNTSWNPVPTPWPWQYFKNPRDIARL